MTGADKTKLNGIAAGADATPFSNTAPVNVTKAAASAGTAVESARQDHKHDVATAAPVTIGVANTEGTSTSLARADHVHAMGAISQTLLQTAFSEITADTTTTSASFVDLLTVTLTTGANSLLIMAAANISNASANVNVQVRVTLDGVAQRGSLTRSPSASGCQAVAITLKRTVSAGSHTIKVQWLTASSTAQCRPITAAVDKEHASLLVQEVTV
jgi:hypothetical protein